MIVVFTVIALLNVWYFYGYGREEAALSIPGVYVIGSDYNLGSYDKTLNSETMKYVFILPHKLEQEFRLRGFKGLSLPDRNNVLKLIRFLEADTEYDGATGSRYVSPAGNNDKTKSLKQRSKMSLQKTACRFSIKHWSVVIRNTGPIAIPENSDSLVQVCNLVQGAFLLRKSIFQSLKWNPEYGKLATLDFFLRSRGKLRIAKLADSRLSRSLNKQDRGQYIGYSGRMFKDYGKIGKNHDVLRIVYPERVEWTKCAPFSKESSVCSRKTQLRSQSNVPLYSFMPICCSSVMNKMLRDVANAMIFAQVDFRVIYNTQMERKPGSKILILNKPELNLAVHKKDNDNSTVHVTLQRLLGPKYFVGEKMHTRLPISLIVPHFTPSRRVNRTNSGGNFLFKHNVILEMKKLLPVTGDLKERGYIKLHPSPQQYFLSSSTVLIGGQKYKGYKSF